MKYLLMLVWLCSFTVGDVSFSGEKLAATLGENVSSTKFKQLSDYWKLNSNLANTERGIRFIYGANSPQIDTILFAGYSYQFHGNSFQPFDLALPYHITLFDNVQDIKDKMKAGSRKIDDDFLIYDTDISVLVHYFSYGRIQWIKIFKTDTKEFMPENEAPDEETTTPVTVATTNKTSATNNLPAAPTFNPQLKNAIIQVFRSWRTSSLKSLKGSARTQPNFWNYKYTYRTNVNLPGELFNMVYSFPFSYSQLDFVSVLKEGAHYDQSFETEYDYYKKLLAATFTEADGWKMIRMPNTDHSKLTNVEFRNQQLGSIILDYSRNPKGAHILYLRFLLFSN